MPDSTSVFHAFQVQRLCTFLIIVLCSFVRATCVADSMLKCLEREMHVRHHRRGTRPLAQLDSKAKQLTDAGELYKAYPIWCEVAHCACTQQGANSPAAVTAMQQVVHIGAQQGTCMPGYVVWLLGRADGRLDDPAMQRLVRRAALSLATCENPRNHTWFTGKVIELVQQLPGGLGWGSTVVAPVPDEEAYARHVFMQRRAFAMVPQPGAGPAEYALARKMLERCIAYYDTLGQHWLGSARRVQCMNRLVINTLHGGAGTAAAVAAALPLSLQAKRVATRELGPQHSTTLGVMWVYAFILGAQGRTETCHSLLHNTLKQRQEVEGVHHADAVFDKVSTHRTHKQQGLSHMCLQIPAIVCACACANRQCVCVCVYVYVRVCL